MADLKPHILCNVIEWVYTAFFYCNSAQQLQNLPEELLFSCFVTMLNYTFKSKLRPEYEGYESGSESLHILTPLRRAPQIYHVFVSQNLSLDPTT